MLTTPTSVRPMRTSALGPTVHAEWTKLRTSRATTVSLGVAAAGSIALGALNVAGRRSEWPSLTDAARAEFDPTSSALVGVILAALVIGALGVRAIATEQSTGMIRLTFVAMPRRRLVLSAKTALAAASGVVVGAVANVVAIVIGQRILEPTVAAPGLDDPAVIRAVAFGALGVGLIAAAGVALGTLLRRAAPANIVLALVVIGGQLIGAALPEASRRYLPSASLEALVTTNPSGDTLGPAVALAVLALEVAAIIGLAMRAIVRRTP